MVDYDKIFQQASTHMAAGENVEAEPLLRQIADAKPHELSVRSMLANTLLVQEKYSDVIDVLTYTLATTPYDVASHTTIATCYDRVGDDARSMAHYDTALALDPDCAVARWQRGMFLLKRGDNGPATWRQGLDDYEYRLTGVGQIGGKAGLAVRTVRPRWDGSRMLGKTLYIAQEQGHGDSVQMARFVREAKERSGAHVILECPQNLVRLYQYLQGPDELVAMPSYGGFARKFDAWIPIMSLPHVLGIQLDDLCTDTYLPRIDAEYRIVESKRIGVAWQGNPNHGSDSKRSIGAQEFLPIVDAARTAGYEVVSLIPNAAVPGDILGRLKKAPMTVRESDPPQTLTASPRTTFDGDFLETARMIASCDLVITVDTAAAHLAGAMGVPVWNLIAHDNDWRWFQRRPDTPWYASMRLWRQKTPDDWTSTVASVSEAMLAGGAESRDLPHMCGVDYSYRYVGEEVSE